MSAFVGSSVRRFAGSPVRRFAGSPVRRFAGSPVRRFAGSPVRRFAGSPVRRFAGSPVRRFAGSPVRRFACACACMSECVPAYVRVYFVYHLLARYEYYESLIDLCIFVIYNIVNTVYPHSPAMVDVIENRARVNKTGDK